ncbi:hypothetical protein DD596_25385, partial [Enterobacter cloacae complex sp. 4DZ3-28B]
FKLKLLQKKTIEKVFESWVVEEIRKKNDSKAMNIIHLLRQKSQEGGLIVNLVIFKAFLQNQ